MPLVTEKQLLFDLIDLLTESCSVYVGLCTSDMFLFPVYVSLLTIFISADALLCRQLKNMKSPADERIHAPTPARVYTHTYIHMQESASIHDASD